MADIEAIILDQYVLLGTTRRVYVPMFPAPKADTGAIWMIRTTATHSRREYGGVKEGISIRPQRLDLSLVRGKPDFRNTTG